MTGQNPQELAAGSTWIRAARAIVLHFFGG